MVSIVGSLVSPENWLASALVLILTTAVLLVARSLNRPPLPTGASLTDKGWPLFGSIGFFTKRGDFLKGGAKKSPNGHFNFYYGSYSIIALSGEAARAAYYTTRGLNLSAGFAALFAAGPDVETLLGKNMNAYFTNLFKRFSSKEHIVKVLSFMTKDTNNMYEKIDTSVPFDPFDHMFLLIYQITHRTVGAHEIANDEKLLKKTMEIYGRLDQSSALQIMFPSLPTPGKISKTWSGIRLHWILSGLVKERRATGKREEDTMQVLMDNGDSDVVISAFIIGALFAGLINTGTQVSWILGYLAHDPHWYARFQVEVDQAVAKHRVSDSETPFDILQRLSLEEWESDFPLIDLGLRESIRLNLAGASMRRNVSGKDVVLGNTGVVIPDQAFAVYGLEQSHLDGNIYSDPYKWDPSRYLPDRAEDTKQAHAYLGWGSGLHPCLGIKLAKIEVFVSIATFIATFNFSLCDKKGNPSTKPLPEYDTNAMAARRVLGEILLKLDRRF